MVNLKQTQLTEIGVDTESGLPARRSVEEENEQERGLVLTQNPNMVVQPVRGPIRQQRLAMRSCVQVSIAAEHNFSINFILELIYPWRLGKGLGTGIVSGHFGLGLG